MGEVRLNPCSETLILRPGRRGTLTNLNKMETPHRECVAGYLRFGRTNSNFMNENKDGAAIMQRLSRMRCSVERIGAFTPVFAGLCGTVHRWSGTVPGSEFGTVPGLQRTTSQELRAALRPGQAQAATGIGSQ